MLIIMIDVKELSQNELIETIRACQNEMGRRKIEEKNSAIETFKQAWLTLTEENDIEIWSSDGQHLYFEDLEFC